MPRTPWISYGAQALALSDRRLIQLLSYKGYDFGEGGMIVTKDERLAREAVIYRDQGKASFTQNAHIRMGYNWRLSEPHAIIGLRHLERLPAMMAARQAIAGIYDKALTGFRNSIPAGSLNGVCNYYKYIAVLRERRDRKELKAILREKYGISLAGEVYEEPLHKQPVFERYLSCRCRCPRIFAQDISAFHFFGHAGIGGASCDPRTEGNRRLKRSSHAESSGYGGSGFIGSHVVDALKDAGFEVTVIDYRVQPHREDVGFENVDLMDLSSVLSATRGAEHIFHLAAVSNVNYAYKYPVTLPLSML